MFCLVPYLAWLAADFALGRAILVGAYLFVSPLIAFTLLSMCFAKLASDRRVNSAVSDPALESMASDFASQLGLPPVTVLLQPSDYDERLYPFCIQGDVIHVYLGPWQKLSEQERRFGMARALAERKHGIEENRRLGPVGHALFFAACLVATVNLWSILALHSGGLLAWFYYCRSKLAVRTLKADAAGLKVAGDPSAAIGFIRKTAGKYEFPEGLTELRLQQIKA